MIDAYNFLLHDIGLRYGDSVVVACSGGPDSMALLSLLCNIKKEIDIEVVCAHVNHNVRRESESEKIFVERFCRDHNVVFEYMKILDYGDDNFESEARTKRYNYFGEIVKKYNAKFLFTAHHGDDLMETILMRIVRGSTLRGYSGFSKIVDKGSYKIVRPLIHVTKDEIVSYDKKNNIKFVIDKTNLDDVHTRNRYRKYVLPFLKGEDPRVHDKFYKFSKTLLEYNDYIDSQVKKNIKKVYSQNVLLIDKFLELDHVICMKIIYKFLEDFYQDDLMLITDRHAELIYNMICSRKSNLSIHLPNNIQAVKSYNNFMLVYEPVNDNEYEIEISEYVNLPNGRNIQKLKKTTITDNSVIRLSSDDVVLPLHVRTRKNGDKIYLKGMIGSKKVKDIFIDSKVPVNLRDSWPIVIDSNNTIVWIPDLKKSKFDRQKGEKCDIILRYY